MSGRPLKDTYVIVADDGQFVALPGNIRSYVTRLRDARTYVSREWAEQFLQDGETIKSVAEIIRERNEQS
jgi:hypothetical protein